MFKLTSEPLFAHSLWEKYQPFALNTERWHLPSLQDGSHPRQIRRNPFLTKCYSENQPHPDLPILPLPHGVQLTSAPPIWWRKRLRGLLGLDRSGVSVPHVAIHEHLEGYALETRQKIANLVSPRLPLGPYLKEILRHHFVVSPPGIAQIPLGIANASRQEPSPSPTLRPPSPSFLETG